MEQVNQEKSLSKKRQRQIQESEEKRKQIKEDFENKFEIRSSDVKSFSQSSAEHAEYLHDKWKGENWRIERVGPGQKRARRS